MHDPPTVNQATGAFLAITEKPLIAREKNKGILSRGLGCCGSFCAATEGSEGRLRLSRLGGSQQGSAAPAVAQSVRGRTRARARWSNRAQAPWMPIALEGRRRLKPLCPKRILTLGGLTSTFQNQTRERIKIASFRNTRLVLLVLPLSLHLSEVTKRFPCWEGGFCRSDGSALFAKPLA